MGLTDGQLVSDGLTVGLARVPTESAVRPGGVTVRVQELDRRLCANLCRESVLPRAMRDARGELILDPRLRRKGQAIEGRAAGNIPEPVRGPLLRGNRSRHHRRDNPR